MSVAEKIQEGWQQMTSKTFSNFNSLIVTGLITILPSFAAIADEKQDGTVEPAWTGGCPVTYSMLKTKLKVAAAQDSTGLNNNYWAVVVNREGTVCAVAYSGDNIASQWLLSRQIAAAKAFTANGLSQDDKPVSTGALYSWVLPVVPQGNPSDSVAPSANPLFGLNGGNPLDPGPAYKGPYNKYGTANDPMLGKRVGGTITFGGGFGLYRGGSTAVGGLGLSGDTACADHSTAYTLRGLLGMAPTTTFLDKITLGPTGHPHCPNDGGTQGTN